MGHPSIADKIDLNDFKRLKHFAIFRNETSSTDFLNPIEIDFQGIEEDKLYLKVPKSSCQIGHLINVILMPKIPDKPIRRFPSVENKKSWIALVGKIIDVDQTTQDKISIHLKINQFNVSDVNSLSEKYNDRQQKINDLLEKGDGD